MQATLAIQLPQALGEGPVWNERQQKIYWTDILNGHLYRATTQGTDLEKRELPFHIGCFTFTETDEILLATSEGLYAYDFEQDAHRRVCEAFELPADMRCNDGKVGVDGAFWFGTMSYSATKDAGSLYRLAPNGELHIEKITVTIPNGLAWHDGTVYFVESSESSLYAVKQQQDGRYDWEHAEVIFKPQQGDLTPDGMTLDDEGNLWIAIWGGAKIIHFNPKTQEILQEIAIPAPYVTSCSFVGADMKTLWITTAQDDLTQEQLEAYPLAGSVFTVPVAVAGKANSIYKGELI